MSKYNKELLLKIDNMKIKESLIKITLLDFLENPIKEIQGKITTGSLNVDGSSAVRRTANLTVLIDEGEDYQLNFLQRDISINKKIKIEIGLKNHLSKRDKLNYSSEDTFWFNQGIYIIKSANFTHNNSSVSISISLIDKMGLLDGTCGGTLPATVIFDEYETLNENGELALSRPTIFQIIQELVNHYGNEQLGKILIDVDTYVRQVMRWHGNVPLYLTGEGNESRYSLVKSGSEDEKEFLNGEDVGYIWTEFTYPGELVGAAGETVCNILDKIVQTLGNYEYFYDVDGFFHFQEIKNYLNTTQAQTIIEAGKNNNDASGDYNVDYGRSKDEYDFTNANLIDSYQNNPQYDMIKNDYIIWGMRKDSSGSTFPIRYHVAIDEKPTLQGNYTVVIHEDEQGVKKAVVPINVSELPEKGNRDLFYSLGTLNLDEPEKSDFSVWKYENKLTAINLVQGLPPFPHRQSNTIYYTYRDGFYSYYDNKQEGPIADTDFTSGEKQPTIDMMKKKLPETGYYKYYIKIVDNENPSPEAVYSYTYYSNIDISEKNLINISDIKDWRTKLFLQGCQAEPYGVDSNPYYVELQNEWLKIYDLNEQEFITKGPQMDYFLDFLDGQSLLPYSVSAIGRRTKVLSDDKINCLFEPDIPDNILIKNNDVQTGELLNDITITGSKILVSEQIYDSLSIGGTYNSAYFAMRDLLYQHLSYNEQITLSSLPIYYLEPNIRVSVNDKESGIQGSYLIKSLSYSFDTTSNMTLTCSKVLEKF